MRLADPKPGFCSRCFAASPERRFVDFECDYDGQAILNPDTGAIAVLPWSGQIATHDNIYMCEPCVKEAAELMGFKPELHARQLKEIRKLEIQVEHWKDTAKRFKDELDKQLAANLGEDTPRRVRRVA